MKEERLYQVLVAPIISEKSTMAADKNGQVVFEVIADATKPEIKEAVEKAFKVEVQGVQVLNQRGKIKRGKIVGVQSSKRKAYVSLKPGYDIDFAGSIG